MQLPLIHLEHIVIQNGSLKAAIAVVHLVLAALIARKAVLGVKVVDRRPQVLRSNDDVVDARQRLTLCHPSRRGCRQLSPLIRRSARRMAQVEIKAGDCCLRELLYVDL